MKHTNSHIHDLQSQLEILERENETLSSMAEINLLLYNAFSEIDNNSDIDHMYQNILEHIAIILHVPFTGMFTCNNKSFICTPVFSVGTP